MPVCYGRNCQVTLILSGSFLLVAQSLPPVGVISPLVLDAFEQELLAYPDPADREYILSGIAQGFRVGYSNSGKLLRSSNRNLKSASLHAEVIDKYLAKEVALNRVAGPFPVPPIHGLHISPFGVIPKRGQPGQWRLILDLSSPHGYSVNDGIPKDPYSLHYASVDDAIRILLQLGPGGLMAKFDVESAYRNVPIHPDDRYLLGMSWRNQYFIDLTLPFGLRSAPYVFNTVATAVEWILHNNYYIRFILHYLDDFLTMAPANSRECYDNVMRARALFNRLGLPLHPDKCVGPTTRLTFLGIELDSITQTARLPQEKFDATLTMLQQLATKKTCTRRELESLVGSLHHACKVVHPGRTFLRRMINLLCGIRRQDHPICLNLEFRRDLAWWLQFFGEWNGVSFFLTPSFNCLPDFHVSSDTAGALGYGAIFRSAWFYGAWPPEFQLDSIAFKELFPIVVAAHLWGNQWSRLRVEFICDNASIVAVLNSGTSRDSRVMHLVRCLT